MLWTRHPVSPNQAGLIGGHLAADAAVTLAAILSNLTNVSTNCPKQLKKVKAIMDMNHDVIFLSDIRLNNSDSVTDLEAVFRSGPNKQYKNFCLTPPLAAGEQGSCSPLSMTGRLWTTLGMKPKIS